MPNQVGGGSCPGSLREQDCRVLSDGRHASPWRPVGAKARVKSQFRVLTLPAIAESPLRGRQTCNQKANASGYHWASQVALIDAEGPTEKASLPIAIQAQPQPNVVNPLIPAAPNDSSTTPMPGSDFDLDSLAAYLHLNLQQVEKLAERGRLPGRRVAGKWRFSKAEIHHWMEERMGVWDDEQLAHVEGALRKSRGVSVDTASMAALLQLECIALPLAARTKGSVITKMVKLATKSGLLWDADKMEQAVRRREDLQSTALDIGVALLHPRRPQASILAGPVMALGITSRGIPFGGGRKLTDVFFLICSTDDRFHLQVLARISRLISSEGLLDSLRIASSAAEVRRILIESEQELAE